MIPEALPASYRADPLAHYAASRARLAGSINRQAVVDVPIMTFVERQRWDSDARVRAEREEFRRAEETRVQQVNLTFQRRCDPYGLIDHIKCTVGTCFGLTVAEMLAQNNSEYASTPRHIAVYLSRDMTGLAYSQIAAFFDRAQSSILQCSRKVERFLEMDPAFVDLVNRIKRHVIGEPIE